MPLGSGASRRRSVPIRLPWTILLPVPPWISMPTPVAPAVAGDQVAGAGRGAADHRIPGSTTRMPPSVLPMAAVPAGVGADVVALHEVARRAGVEQHPVCVVAGDDVPLRRPSCRRSGCRWSPRSRESDVDAALAVAESRRAGGVGADVVADDDVRRRGDADAVERTLPEMTFRAARSSRRWRCRCRTPRRRSGWALRSCRWG